MKKLLLVVSILSALNYSCSKKDHWMLGPGVTRLPLIEYPVDLNFTINTISYSTDSSSASVWKKGVMFYASSNSNLPNDSSGTNISANQIYSNYYDYETYSDVIFHFSTKQQPNPSSDEWSVNMLVNKNFNFFTLSYQSGIASFSDTCYVISGNGKYKTAVQSFSPLIFSGSIDALHSTGNIRIKGSIFLQQ